MEKDHYLMDEFSLFLREHVSQSTAMLAVIAAGGALILWIGLTSITRVSLADEAARVKGVQVPSVMDRLQAQLTQSGLQITVWEFLAVGTMLGAVVGGIFLLLGFTTIGILAIPAGLVAYYQYLMHRRAKVLQTFREMLPDAIDDCADHISTYNNTMRAVQELAERGPSILRPEFVNILALSQGGISLHKALREAAGSRREVFFRQFLDALANYEAKGGDVRGVLERIAHAQRTQLRLQRRIVAAQAGGRLIGWAYGIAPAGFLVFMRLFGGDAYNEFYHSFVGQVAQVLVVASGVATWWLTRQIARRGIYLDENIGAVLNPSEHKVLLSKDME
ncbi:MAG: type II secretion system F family protein [Chloroflexi bacterium]|nr:type II secretion system F family protein [Chloroflexota bacterium]